MTREEKLKEEAGRYAANIAGSFYTGGEAAIQRIAFIAGANWQLAQADEELEAYRDALRNITGVNAAIDAVPTYAKLVFERFPK